MIGDEGGGRGRGFALAEVLVAGTVTLLLAAALVSLLGPGNLAFRAQPAFTDMRQRLRFAMDVLAARVSCAGSAPTGGLSGGALGVQTACLLPYRIGHRKPDPPGSWVGTTLALIAGRPGASVAFLRTPLPAGESLAELDAGRCPSASPTCGIVADTNVLLLPGGGQADLYRVEAVAPQLLTLAPASTTPPRAYPAGTPVVCVDIDVFYVRDGSDGRELMRYDGWESDLPLLDHVARFEVDWFGTADPPRFRAEGAPAPGPTYGPAPPPAGLDLPEDPWGPGENCVFNRVDGLPAPRLPAIGADPLSLVVLDSASLTDGPWCAHGTAAGRFDADLLRVRRVRLTLVVEATAAGSRGPEPGLFHRPGFGSNPLGAVPDQQLALDVVPRSLGGW